MSNSRHFILLAVGLFTLGFAATIGWLVSNEDRLTNALMDELNTRLVHEIEYHSIQWNVWSHFPDVSLVGEDVVILGAWGAEDTLLRAQHIELACNAFSLIRGQYALNLLEIQGASAHIKTKEGQPPNWRVWQPLGNEDSEQSNFSIQSLELEDVQFEADNRQVHVARAAIELNWDSSGFSAWGTSDLASIDTPEFQLDSSIQWEGRWAWNESTGKSIVEVDSWEWMGANASGLVVFNSNGASAHGKIRNLSFPAMQHLFVLPPPWDDLSTTSTADGTVSWESDVFKSHWTVREGDWLIPTDEAPLSIRANGSVWLKYENDRWRADVPRVQLKGKGIHWVGKIDRIALETGSFEAEGQAQIDFNVVDKAAFNLPEVMETGKFNYQGNAQRLSNGQWDFQGNWTANDFSGTQNSVRWTASAQGTVKDNAVLVSDGRGTWDGIPFQGNLVGRGFIQGSLPNEISGNLQLPEWTYQSNENEEGVNLFDFQLPSTLRISLQTKVDHVAWDAWNLYDLDFQLNGTSAEWSIPRFHARSLEGTLTGDGSVRFNEQMGNATLLIHPTVKAFNLPELFFSFENFGQNTLRTEHLSGTMDASGSVQFTVNSAFEWQPESLDILGSATIESGTLSKLEAFQDIAEYLRNNRMMAPLVDPDDLSERLAYVEFDKLQSPVYVSKGIVQVPNIEIRSSAMNITLEGRYGFDSSIDYTLGFAVRDLRASQQSEFGPIEDDGLGQQFFISMDGTINEPVYSWDREAQKSHRKENFQREKELLKELFRKSSP